MPDIEIEREVKHSSNKRQIYEDIDRSRKVKEENMVREFTHVQKESLCKVQR